MGGIIKPSTKPGEDHSFQSVRSFFNMHVKSPPLFSALYVPLADSALSEPFNPRQFTCLPWTRSFVHQHLTPENRRALERFDRRERAWPLVVLGVPRAKGGRALVGLGFKDVSGGNPLGRGTTPHPPRYVVMKRRDRAVITARAEGAVELQKKGVAIVGCGAIGGRLAVMLARAGVGRLTLIDPDTLEAANSLRHVLGKAAIGSRKVHALQREITAKVPYITIDTHARNIEELLQTPTFNLGPINLLVYAAGDPTVGLYVNERGHDLPDGPPLLFTWLEPYGLGGHVMVTNTHSPGARGCFSCLFDSPIGCEPRHNRADFAAPEQDFAKNVTGCAAMYTPYADLDAVRTAELAARLALDVLRGRRVGHPVLSWKGDGEAFHAAGFMTSRRYERDEGELHRARFDYVRETCTVCRSAA